MEPIFVGKSEAARMVGLSVRTLDRMEANGSFPKKIHLTGRKVGWKYADLVQWSLSLA